MERFTYHEPRTIRGAIELLETFGEPAKLIAGGTDLVVEIKQGKRSPRHVISLHSLGLDEITHSSSGLRIGSMATFRAIERSDVIRERFTCLSDAVDELGSVQVRNVATIGGNICNAAPSADTAAPLLALDAMLVIEGPTGEKTIPISEFYSGPYQTALGYNEILKNIVIPDLPPRTGTRYMKLARRRAMALPLLGVAVVVVPVLEEKVCAEARIGLALAGPIPMRARRAEEFVAGRPLTYATWEQAGEIAVSESSPRTSFRTTAEYRKKMIRVLVPRAAEEALQRVNIQLLKE